VSQPNLARAKRSIRRWKFASAFLAIGTFTTIVGFYVPLHRENGQLVQQLEELTARSTALTADLETSRSNLQAAEAKSLKVMGELDAQKTVLVEVKKRIEKLKESLTRKFSRLDHASMLTVSSAGDRVSVAIAHRVLFPGGRSAITKNGRILLCQLSKVILAEYGGQIRVTGYYGKPRIDDAALRKEFGSPWELSAARAAAAVDVLERGCGAPTDRFFVVGYGPRAAGPLGENVALEFIVKATD
jgi:chemotaxis protein MotB